MNSNRVAIIGAGPAGLATGRVLKLLGIPFTIYEKHSGAGGIWDRTNSGSPMYQSAHFISSKTMSGHVGFPMPSDYPDYPSNGQILDYIHSFVSAYGLDEYIRFNSLIDSVEQVDGQWLVRPTGEQARPYRWLVCASGTTWSPNRPALRGEEFFNGEIMHSVNYDDSDFLRGKRVLVVGAGNSGVDIACDAAFAAESAHISLRRGYHFIPKHLFGLPADVFAKKTGGGPVWLEQALFGGILRILNGDLTRLGLQKPDHKVMSSHPIMNTQILHYLQHGDLTAHHDIAYLDGDTVHFVNGESIEVDLIILATGYNWRVPYLPEDLFQWQNGRPNLYLKVFEPTQPTLFVNGFVETNGGAYHLFDDMAYLIGKTIESQRDQLPAAAVIAQTIQGASPDLSGRIKFVQSDRHTNYANTDTFVGEMKKFRDKFGWPSLETLLEQSPSQIAQLV